MPYFLNSSLKLKLIQLNFKQFIDSVVDSIIYNLMNKARLQSHLFICSNSALLLFKLS